MSPAKSDNIILDANSVKTDLSFVESDVAHAGTFLGRILSPTKSNISPENAHRNDFFEEQQQLDKSESQVEIANEFIEKAVEEDEKVIILSAISVIPLFFNREI